MNTLGDVLSQEEIDRLLQGISTGELDAEEMKEAPSENLGNHL